MNSQQAINLLKGLEQSLDDYCELNDEGKAAFRMAITALELFGNSEQLPSAQPEIIRYLDTVLHPIVSPEHWDIYSELYDMISVLPSAQLEIIRCKDCKWFNTAGCVIEIVDKSDKPTEDGSCSFAERRQDE